MWMLWYDFFDHGQIPKLIELLSVLLYNILIKPVQLQTTIFFFTLLVQFGWSHTGSDYSVAIQCWPTSLSVKFGTRTVTHSHLQKDGPFVVEIIQPKTWWLTVNSKLCILILLRLIWLSPSFCKWLRWPTYIMTVSLRLGKSVIHVNDHNAKDGSV